MGMCLSARVQPSFHFCIYTYTLDILPEYGMVYTIQYTLGQQASSTNKHFIRKQQQNRLLLLFCISCERIGGFSFFSFFFNFFFRSFTRCSIYSIFVFVFLFRKKKKILESRCRMNGCCCLLMVRILFIVVIALAVVSIDVHSKRN